jgi:hypothetical protein
MTFFGDAVDDALAANCARTGGIWVGGADLTSAVQNAQNWTAGPDAGGPVDVGVQLPTAAAVTAEVQKLPWWAWLLIGATAVKLLGGRNRD